MELRNFCIIAHIDHGKSTLADRFLEFTGTIAKNKLHAQFLDQMDLEQERGITIKLQPVRMNFTTKDGVQCVYNLIDTPGHVDFTYEVSRSIAACEGAILVVDAVQGIQAQTLANLYLALEQNLTIIPVINKIDLPNARLKEVKNEIMKVTGAIEEEIYCISAKNGTGVMELLEGIYKKVPAPKQDASAPFRALIFDSQYNSYQGVVAHVRVSEGKVKAGDTLKLFAIGDPLIIEEVGYFKPKPVKAESLSAGEVGYVVTGLRKVRDCKVGDTLAALEVKEALPGYKKVQPMVYASFYPLEGDDYHQLRDALEKLQLNDAALSFEPESSVALGRGFRCGFLGILHLEIVQERLKREFNLQLLVTLPSVAHTIQLKKGQEQIIYSPVELPDPTFYDTISEPWIKLEIVTSAEAIGIIMALCTEYRGVYKQTEYLDETRAILHYEIPLASVIIDFYDRLKSASAGYASMYYELLENRPGDLIKMDVLIAGEKIDALSRIVLKNEAFREGRDLTIRLKDLIPKHQFTIPIQAAIGGKIIARETISAYRKDVTGYLYGGDVTRKRKLLEKQKKGKKKMKETGRVNIPENVYFEVLKRKTT